MKQLATWMLVLGTLAACHHDTGKACTGAGGITIMNVDDNTPAMQQLYKHVEADPAAAQAGIKAEIDQWHTDGQSTHTDYFLTGPDPAAITKYVASLAPELQPTSAEKLVFEHLTDGGGWRSYVVSSTVLDGSAIASVAQTKSDDRPSLTITFTDQGKQAFAAATEKSVGHKMATMVDGVVTSAPVINGKIAGGKAMITFRNAAEAEALVKKLGC